MRAAKQTFLIKQVWLCERSGKFTGKIIRIEAVSSQVVRIFLTFPSKGCALRNWNCASGSGMDTDDSCTYFREMLMVIICIQQLSLIVTWGRTRLRVIVEFGQGWDILRLYVLFKLISYSVAHSLTKMIMILKQVFLSTFKTRKSFDLLTSKMAFHHRGPAFKTNYVNLKCVSRDEHGRNDDLQGKGPLLNEVSGEGCMLNLYEPCLLTQSAY